MLLSPEHGEVAYSPEQAEELNGAGFQKCYKPSCNFFISPQAKSEVETHQDQGYYTCPKCNHSYDLMDHLPWHGAPEEYLPRLFEEGGATRIGLTMVEQAQIGEDLIREHGLPGYGPILWWHEGGASAASPLDGTTKEWGIEVKTLGFDATHHRFIPGSPEEKGNKNRAAAELKLKGVLGVLVMLNYRTSMASVYVKEMPLETWTNATGRQINGVAAFRSNSGQRLLEEIPFKNPFMDPHSGAPHAPIPHDLNDDLPF
jgi:hypothetical protein